jgi:hypothetical protein
MAAGVTDKLWEMTDIVDVTDSFEVKANRSRKPIFEVEKWAIGGSYYIRVTFPDGTTDKIEGFATESEAGRRIRNEAGVWLHQRQQAE